MLGGPPGPSTHVAVPSIGVGLAHRMFVHAAWFCELLAYAHRVWLCVLPWARAARVSKLARVCRLALRSCRQTRLRARPRQ